MRPIAPCPFCGYDLGGLDPAVRVTCPECGRTCTLGDIARASSRVPFWWLGCVVATPVVMFVAGFAAWLLLGPYPGWAELGPPGAGFVAGFAWNLVALRRAKLLRPGVNESPWSRFFIVVSEFVLATSLAALVSIFSGLVVMVAATLGR